MADAGWMVGAGLGVLPAPGPASLLGLVAVTTYATVTPDVDHQHSKLRYALPPAYGLFVACRWVCRRTAGERVARQWFSHRRITHSISFAVVLGVLVTLVAVAGTPQPFRWLAAATFAWVALPWVTRYRRGRPERLVVVAAGAGLLAIAPWPAWLGLAVALGCLAHIAGDSLTNSGVPALAPFTWRRFGLRRLSTNTRGERRFARAQVLVSAVLAGVTVFFYGGGSDVAVVEDAPVRPERAVHQVP